MVVKTLQLKQVTVDSAQEHIERFIDRYGEPHLRLLYHAAFPLSLTPGLVYQLWVSLRETDGLTETSIPWIAVSDILLSSFCDNVGHNLFEFEPDVRSELLKRLRNDPRYGQSRLKELAEFVIAYSANLDPQQQDVRDSELANTLRIGALAQLNPKAAAIELAEAISFANQKDIEDLNRVAEVVQRLSEPLSEYPMLLTYALGMSRYARDDVEGATKHFQSLLHSSYKPSIEGIPLLFPDGLLLSLPNENKSPSYILHRTWHHYAVFSVLTAVSFMGLNSNELLRKRNSSLLSTPNVSTQTEIPVSLSNEDQISNSEFSVFGLSAQSGSSREHRPSESDHLKPASDVKPPLSKQADYPIQGGTETSTNLSTEIENPTVESQGTDLAPQGSTTEGFTSNAFPSFSQLSQTASSPLSTSADVTTEQTGIEEFFSELSSLFVEPVEDTDLSQLASATGALVTDIDAVPSFVEPVEDTDLSQLTSATGALVTNIDAVVRPELEDLLFAVPSDQVSVLQPSSSEEENATTETVSSDESSTLSISSLLSDSPSSSQQINESAPRPVLVPSIGSTAESSDEEATQNLPEPFFSSIETAIPRGSISQRINRNTQASQEPTQRSSRTSRNSSRVTSSTSTSSSAGRSSASAFSDSGQARVSVSSGERSTSSTSSAPGEVVSASILSDEGQASAFASVSTDGISMTSISSSSTNSSSGGSSSSTTDISSSGNADSRIAPSRLLSDVAGLSGRIATIRGKVDHLVTDISLAERNETIRLPQRFSEDNRQTRNRAYEHISLRINEITRDIDSVERDFEYSLRQVPDVQRWYTGQSRNSDIQQLRRIRRLQEEIAAELAVLRGRRDGLEQDVLDN